MAECRVRLIDDADHYNAESSAIGSKGFPRYGSSNYSNVTPLETHPEFYIQHQVTGSDTLNSVALKYGLNASKIKSTNRLWNDNIFLCKQLLIPVVDISEYENKDYKIVSKFEVFKGILKSKSVGHFEQHKGNFSAQHSGYNPEILDSNSNDEERLDNVDCLKGTDTSQVSVQDYFKKFDSSLAKIKKNVEKLDKQNRSASSIQLSPQPFPHDFSKQDGQTSSGLYYRSTGNNCEQRMREKFEKIENEMFQL